MRYDCIIWDWNGTLINDMPTALMSVNDILAKRNKPPITEQQYWDYLDTPIVKFYEHLFDLNEVPFSEIIDEYHDGYRLHLDGSEVTPSIRSLLEKFKKSGIEQAIVSACEQCQLDGYLREYGIYDYFTAIIGAENYNAESKVERADVFIKEHGSASACACRGRICAPK